jgi:transcriptional regulator with XRE-family HTH domain
MGVDPTYISQLEKRTTAPSYETRQRIHEALGTTEDELIALGIVRARGARSDPVPRAINEPRPSYAAADAFIRSLSPRQKQLLRAALDEGERPRPGDEEEDATAEERQRYQS